MPCGKGQWSVPSPGTHRRTIRRSDKLWLAASGLAEVSGSRGNFGDWWQRVKTLAAFKKKDARTDQRRSRSLLGLGMVGTTDFDVDPNQAVIRSVDQVKARFIRARPIDSCLPWSQGVGR